MVEDRTDRTRPSRAGPNGEVVDFERYLPTALSKLVSELRSSANAFFVQRYGVSLIDWRILSFLAAEGAASAYAIWTEGELDKAAVSRALRALEKRGLVSIAQVPRHPRLKLMVTLTPAGQTLHGSMHDEIMDRHARLIEGLPSEDVMRLLEMLRHLRCNIPAMASLPEGAKPRPPKPKRSPVP